MKNDAILSSETKTTFHTTMYQIPQDYGTKRIDGLRFLKHLQLHVPLTSITLASDERTAAILLLQCG